MKTCKLVLSLFAIMSVAQAATIAIIDSGTDFRHESLKSQIWTNPIEKRANGADDDGNGYADDIRGWNFAENNNQVIDFSYLGNFSEKPYKFFELQLKRFHGTITEEETAWIKREMQNQETVKELQKFGNFVHGTHVAGIAAEGNDNAKILTVKIIPTEVKLPFPMSVKKAVEAMMEKEEGQAGFVDWKLMALKFLLGQLAKAQAGALTRVGEYVSSHKADIANGSFGTGYAQVEMIVTTAFKAALKRDPEAHELEDLTKNFLNVMIAEGRKMLQAADDTFFVFAAGNDGKNNDVYPVSPANIKAPNAITVAATFNRSSIAPFSNFGTGTVDVAAPGVGINSAIPGDEYLRVSGTSQAAPYVANIAAKIKDINPYLNPRDIKKMIMETVDYKAYLQNKVTAAGIVNTERALKSAQLSMLMPIHQAISNARLEVKDVPELKMRAKQVKFDKRMILPLPSPFILN